MTPTDSFGNQMILRLMTARLRSIKRRSYNIKNHRWFAIILANFTIFHFMTTSVADRSYPFTQRIILINSSRDTKATGSE